MMYLITLLVLLIMPLQSISEHDTNELNIYSDIFNKLFSKEIQSILNLTDISLPGDGYNSTKCSQSFSSLFPQNILPFIDSSGRIPSGILNLNTVSIGNFDQCTDISINLSDDIGTISGQYCFASVLLKIPFLEQNNSTLMNKMVTDPKALTSLKIGICVPDTCDSEELTQFFQRAVNASLATISVSQCQTSRKPDVDASEIAGITILSIFGVFILLSSSYDLLMRYLKTTPKALLLAFSIFANCKKLFAINTKTSTSSIECLNGIRVFSMAWVVYAHNYAVSTITPLINGLYFFQWSTTAGSLHVLNATVSVDSFLFISGLLIAWLGFQELEKTNGKLNVVKMYAHRYIRLAPPVAIVIIFLISAYRLLINGPFREVFLSVNGNCSQHWWVTLLFIQNYLWSDDICLPQTWYLGVDFQLYILSPLILIPMWKWGKKFYAVIIVLGLLSIGCVMGTFFTNGYNDFLGLNTPERMRKVYFPTHTRCAPWLVGIGLGYFMHINRHKTYEPAKWLQLLGWTVSFVTIVAIVFGTYFSMHSDKPTTVFEATMYESLKRVSWAIALAWIVFACHFGFGGLVNTFLSHPFWQPLSRLTYSLYLVHLAVLGINYGITRTESYFSEYNKILTFWSTFGSSLIAAIALTLAFEAPILVIEKSIFGKGDSKKNEDAHNTVTEDQCNKTV